MTRGKSREVKKGRTEEEGDQEVREGSSSRRSSSCDGESAAFRHRLISNLFDGKLEYAS